jgi:hypothetical protein
MAATGGHADDRRQLRWATTSLERLHAFLTPPAEKARGIVPCIVPRACRLTPIGP